MKNSNKTKANKRLLIFMLLAVGVLVRFAYLGAMPGGVNQDEAYAGYEAYSLLHYGTDSHGYAFPVYFTSWGSGMNALYSYLSMPFIAAFGLNTLSIRLVQAILGCVSLPVFYLATKRLANEKAAMLSLFLLVINPWHIMLCRWGLEANIAPAFVLFGFYCMLKAVDDRRFLLLSALMYGLALYCYSSIWPVLPIIIFGEVLYLVLCHKLRIDRYLVAFALLLFVMAVPLFLFLAVQSGIISELRTPFLSIPKLAGMREVFSLRAIPRNIANLFKLIVQQTDNLPQNTVQGFGNYYNFSTVFILLGAGIGVLEAAKAVKKKQYDANVLMLIWLGGAALLGVLTDVNTNRINIIHMPIIYFCAMGIEQVTLQVWRNIKPLAAMAYVCCFIGFMCTYITSYRGTIATEFTSGAKEALEYAQRAQSDIYIEDMNYAKVLFYTKAPVTQFVNTAKYDAFSPEWLRVSGFDKYHFGTVIQQGAQDKNSAYIYPTTRKDYNQYFNDQGFAINIFESYTVATHE